MKKALSCLFLAWGLALVALPSETFSADYGFCGSVPVDCVTKKGWCSMTPSSTLSFPYGTVAVNPCTTSTVASTAIGTTSQVEGTVVLRCPDGKICSADLPSSTYKVQCTEGDASQGYLHDKISAGSGITITTSTGGGGVQTETISATAVSDTYQLMCSVTDAVPDYLHSKLASGEGIYTTKITDIETGKEAVQISSFGGVAAVEGDIPDVLYNRLVVNGDGLNETIVGSARTRQVKIGLTNPRKADVAYMFGFGVSSGACLIDATTWDNTSSGVWQTKANQSIIGSACVESGIVPSAGDRVLVASPGNGSPAYGIFEITSTGSSSSKAIITRSSDAQDGQQFSQGTEIRIRRGHLYGGASAVLLTSGPYTLDSTSLVFGVYGGLQATNFSGSANNAQISEADLYLSNNTVADVSSYQHGLAPRCPGGTTTFWRADCTWAEAGGSGGGPELDRIVAAYQTGWRWFYPRYQSIQNWRAMGALGSSVYASVSNGDIYKQTNGTGNFVALGQTARNWTALASCGSDMLAFVYGGDIYKQTNGTGDFVALSQTSRNWNAATTVGTNVYALEYGGGLYKLTDCTGDFANIGGVSVRSYYGLTALGTTLYASTYGTTGDILIRNGADGTDFGTTGPQVARDYRQMTSDGTNIYVAVWGEEPCVLLNGAGPAFPMGEVTRNWHNIVYNGIRLYASGYGTDIFTTF